MLQAIRDKATGWIAWVIVILLIIPFALWGINEYFSGTAEVNVAEVNGVEISRDLFNQYLQRELNQREEPPEGAALDALRKSVLDRMINEELLAQAAAGMGMRIAPEALAAQVRTIEAFQREGQFDQDQYRRVLLANGLTVAAFEAQQIRAMLIQQLMDGVQKSAFLPKASEAHLLAVQEREIELSWLAVPVERFEAGVEVSEADVESWFSEHAGEYVEPEKVRVDYILLDVRDLEKRVEVDEVELRSLYEQQKGLYRTDEQRKLAHILIRIDEAEGGREAALEKAAELRRRIADGEEFSALAREFSQDPGSAKQGGELGYVARGIMDPKFDEVAFSLNKGEVSQPVETPFGIHLIKVEEIKPGREKSFDEVRAELEREYRRNEAENLFYDLADQLYDITYENPNTLEPAAEQLGLVIRTSDWFTRAGGEGVAAEPAVVQTAFGEEVLGEGDPARSLNSRPIELKRGGARDNRITPVVVLRLNAHRSQRPKKLEEVRDQITAQLRRQRALAEAEQLRDRIADERRSGRSLEELAQEHGLEVAGGEFGGRYQGGVDGALLKRAFRTPRPAEGGVSVGTVALTDGSPAVFLVSGVRDASVGDEDPKRSFMARILRTLYGSAETTAFMRQLREEANIVLFEDHLKAGDEG